MKLELVLSLAKENKEASLLDYATPNGHIGSKEIKGVVKNQITLHSNLNISCQRKRYGTFIDYRHY